MKCDNQYIKIVSILQTIKHGQEVQVDTLLTAYDTALRFGKEHLTCINKDGKRVTVKIESARRCLQGFGDEKTLKVKCDNSGFIFTLTDERKRENLRKNGRSEDEIERMMSNED